MRTNQPGVYRLQFVDAFTETPGTGNRAGVVLDAENLTAAQMQAIAREAGVSETAFGISSSSEEYDLQVRYFSRTREVPICGHATIAFHYLRALAEGLQSRVVRVKTGAGILPVAVEGSGRSLRITMTQAAPRVVLEPDDVLQSECISALGLRRADLVRGLPIQTVSTGHAKVLIAIRSYSTLNALRPDRTLLTMLSRRIGADGFFVFTLDRQREDVLYHGRMFAPATGVDEDPVTGNANGPAGYYLFTRGFLAPPENGVIRYTAVQGEAMGRPGLIEVILHVSAGKVRLVQVAGRAVAADPPTLTRRRKGG